MAQLTRNNHHHSSNELLAHPLLRLQKEFSHTLNDFYDLFEPVRNSLLTLDNMTLSPSLDIVEDEKCFKIEAEMPGMGEEDLKGSFNENRLTIEGEKTTSKKDDQKNFLSREISYGHYERTIALPLSADVSKASASFKKGMLWVTIPKKQKSESATKTIKVESAE